jgi:hypothetical protein
MSDNAVLLVVLVMLFGVTSEMVGYLCGYLFRKLDDSMKHYYLRKTSKEIMYKYLEEPQ